MPRQESPEQLTVRETLSELNVDGLKDRLAVALGRAGSGRKAELIDQLAAVLLNAREVAKLYEGLDDLGKKAVQEAAHDPQGVWHRSRFEAKYGGLPSFTEPGRYSYQSKPARLGLFFPRGRVLPTDLRKLLLGFVPEPARLTVAGQDELPAKVGLPVGGLGGKPGKPEEEAELRVCQTARAALLDVKAVLRLIDAGGVKVGEKTRRPSQAALKAVAGVLSEGDFYDGEERSEWSHDPGSDLTIKAFAWPMLLQAAGLAGTAGSKLQLTPAGRKATTGAAQAVIRQVWGKWLKTTLLDEFNRVDAIKGQQTKGSLTAVAPRRQAIVEALKECPAGKWVRVEDLFRVLGASERPYEVGRDSWKLYVGMLQYGSFDYDAWESLEGRYALAFLFEYAATLGLLDVAYVSPIEARNDHTGHWGTDDLSCLSRYDGLMYFRINPLGAWCLGLADAYVPQEVVVDRVLRVLPNLDVVAADRPPSAADVLFLERFAERRSESVWHVERQKVLGAVEQGLTVGELREFLTARSQGPLPQTAEVFLDDLEAKAGQVEDLGAARLLGCKDAVVAQTLAADRRLRNLCQVAGERCLVFRASDEAAVRRGLRELGYVLPPPG